MPMGNHVIKSLTTNLDILVRAVQDQMQKQSDVGSILTSVWVDANNEIYSVAYDVVEAESKASWCWFLNLLGENLGIEANFNYTFISDRQKPLQNAAKATSEGKFKKKMDELKSFNSDAYDWLMKITLEQWSKAYFSGRAKCDILINNICEKVITKTVGPLTPSMIKMFDAIKKMLLSTMFNGMELTGILCKHVVAAIYNMSENSVGVGIPEQWVHAAYRLDTWAHVYSFKVNPCNGRDMWPVVESRTVIIPPLYKPPIGRLPKKRKQSNVEIASQSASSSKLYRKGKSVSCGKCGNVGHNRKGCRGQGGGFSQAGARKVSDQAAGATNVSGKAAGARKVSGQAASSRKVSGQAADARKASSQPSAAQSTTKQGPRQGKSTKRQMPPNSKSNTSSSSCFPAQAPSCQLPTYSSLLKNPVLSSILFDTWEDLPKPK
ncbi:hypothetical protein Tco_1395970 [Tanacetum coccineum]